MRSTYLLIGSQRSKVRISNWISPYTKKGNANYKHSKKCGVYLVRSRKSKKILYVGYSGYDLKKTLYRHFQSWNDSTQFRAVYKNRNLYQIKVIECSCSAASKLEKYLIKKYKPRDNHLKYKSGSLFAKSVKILPTGFNTTNPKAKDFVPF